MKKKGGKGIVVLPDAGEMGTDKAFVNKGDGDGLGHTAKLSGFGTNTAFMNKGDGKDQSTKGRIEMLAGISCAVRKRFLSYPLTALGPTA